ncbi:hypothetical protein GE061_009489 [Apolygus lucorum]|uniref:LRRCT domain-containing protein n=1 Tax=Apolygus lucorum TaxID=248454 RepID=A0A8S9Y318_APOLU|nr:hypothetical protein GE061_009489 [Apolygus lucorum]
MLGGNRWICDCGLVWVGHWLRRWLRESLELHSSAVDPQVLAIVREAVCIEPRSQQFIPLIDLHPETLSCHASALSRGKRYSFGFVRHILHHPHIAHFTDSVTKIEVEVTSLFLKP